MLIWNQHDQDLTNWPVTNSRLWRSCITGQTPSNRQQWRFVHSCLCHTIYLLFLATNQQQIYKLLMLYYVIMFGQSNGEFHEELGKLLMIISGSHSPAVWHLKFCHNLYAYTFLIANADLSKYFFLLLSLKLVYIT